MPDSGRGGVSLEEERRRRLNENRASLFGATNPERLIVFLCECSDADCRETILLSARAYTEQIEAGGLVVHEGHTAAA